MGYFNKTHSYNPISTYAQKINEDLLNNLYHDLEIGYGSKQSFYNQAKEKGASVTSEEVAKGLRKQPNKQIQPY